MLKYYIETQDEQALYGAEKITKGFIKKHILPEEIINLHIQAFSELYPNVREEVTLGMNFLLETMISYGMAHQENKALRDKQLALEFDISVADELLTTFYESTKHTID